jgi:hypothetical protein
MMEKDDAVSTVIAMMLILGIVATLLAIYSATYLPGLKQQSEIEHSREVANAFARFGSDIDYVISHKKTARFSEPFSLGGGDILLSPVRSSGLVTIEERPLVIVTVTYKEEGSEKEKETVASLVNVSYVPSFTSWEPQGYLWEYGFVAVTKGNVTVPQSSQYNTMDEARADSDRFLESFIDISPLENEIEITVVNLTCKEDGYFITGSGIATLGVDATASELERLEDVNEIIFENCTVSDDDKVSVMMGKYLEGLEDKLGVEPGYDSDTHTHTFEYTDNNPTVTLRTVNVEVSVW